MFRRTAVALAAAAALVAGGAVTVTAASAETVKPLVALTFDDGPDPVRTPYVLDILKAKGVRATFFLQGSEVAKYPAVVKRIHDEGHVIGNHSWSHPNFRDSDWDDSNGLNPLSYAEARKQIVDTNNAIMAITGEKPILFRYPFGEESAEGNQAIRDEGMWGGVLWHWSYSPAPRQGRNFDGDWNCQETQSDLQDFVLGNSADQAIILLHDAGDAGACPVSHWNYLSPTIDALKARGYDLGVVEIAFEASVINQYSWVKVVPAPVTVTPTPTVTETETVTPTPTVTETVTPTPTVTETVTPTPTVTETVTPTPTVTETVTPTPTVTPKDTRMVFTAKVTKAKKGNKNKPATPAKVTGAGVLYATKALVAGKTLQVSFQANSTGAFVPVGTVTTSGLGTFTFTSDKAQAGTWKVEFAGDATHKPTSTTAKIK